jgi:hypothetical protein
MSKSVVAVEFCDRFSHRSIYLCFQRKWPCSVVSFNPQISLTLRREGKVLDPRDRASARRASKADVDRSRFDGEINAKESVLLEVIRLVP